jgi:hypothetical protein
MLIVNDIKYQSWAPSSEEEFEELVKTQAQNIFGEKSIYLDIKHKIKSNAGISAIPDGLVILLGTNPTWSIVEVELSSHNPYEHILPQISKFTKAINNPANRQKIIEVLYREIIGDQYKLSIIKNHTSAETHKFISDCISNEPEIVIIIEKDNEVLNEAIEALAQRPKVVTFQIFFHSESKSFKYAFLFEPLFIETSEKEKSGYFSLFNELRKDVSNSRPKIKTLKPTAYYSKVPVGHSALHLEWLVKARENKLGVELHLERNNYADNLKLINILTKRINSTNIFKKDNIEFQNKWHTKWARIYIEKTAEKLPDLKQWAVDKMIEFYDVFKPILDEVDK